MKGVKFLRFCLLLFVIAWKPLYAQESYCKNLNFELGNFTNWVGYTWLYSTEVPSINTSKVAGIINRRQTIISDVTAYDANTGNALKKIPSGYLYSARLGDEITSSDSNPRCWEQSLRYTMVIDSTNALLIMKFALVLQYASDHTAKMEPRFKLTLFNQKGDTINDCANYDVYSSSSNAKGFQTYTPVSSSGTNTPVKWRDWTTVGANLLKYIGQTITVEFMSADCTGRYHYGYAYFVAECHPLYITVKYCAGDSNAILTAPEGFETYSWTDSSGTVVSVSQTLSLSNPTEGAIYSCTMTSATGCTVSLHSTIVKYVIKTDFSSYMLDCRSNKVQFTNLSTTTHGSLLYNWNFGDGNTSTEVSPQYTFATSGLHTVRLALSNPPSLCVDTLTKQIESFSPPLVGIKGDTTYCPGLSTVLKAYGAYKYDWSNGSVADSIEVRAPGGKFWMLGHSSTGCTSDTIFRTVSLEPDWEFLSESDTTFCVGDSAILKVTGGATYLWSTRDTTSSITVKTPGEYLVTGANKRGCKKSFKFNVTKYQLPDADFDLSALTLDSRHNQITFSSSGQSDVVYLWDFGDGSTQTGSAVQHTYTISNAILEYTITLLATTPYGCTKTTSKTIDVVPFIPNVFSPNGDGINDVFLPLLDLQIFDRYGTILYKGNAGWNGTWHGRVVDPDTYFYIVDYKNKNDKVVTRKGYITLVK